MADSSDHPVTTLIEAARAGDSNAASQLVPLLYGELRRLAQQMLAKRVFAHGSPGSEKAERTTPSKISPTILRGPERRLRSIR